MQFAFSWIFVIRLGPAGDIFRIKFDVELRLRNTCLNLSKDVTCENEKYERATKS